MFVENWYKYLYSLFSYSRPSSNKVQVKTFAGSNVYDAGIDSSTSSSALGPWIFNNNYQSGDSYYSASPYYLSNGSTIYYGTTSMSTGAGYCGTLLGDGDTAVELSDYCLSGNIITDFSATTSYSISIQNGKIIGTATYNITNTGASDITIREVALTRGDQNANRVMIARKVLATPLTIEPGATGILSYEIELS